MCRKATLETKQTAFIFCDYLAFIMQSLCCYVLTVNRLEHLQTLYWFFFFFDAFLGFKRQLNNLRLPLNPLSAAIRFGRMPQSEKLKLKAEMVTGEREVVNPQLADQKTLARQIYEAYLKNFSMNKAKARTILTGKTSNPVR